MVELSSVELEARKKLNDCTFMRNHAVEASRAFHPRAGWQEGRFQARRTAPAHSLSASHSIVQTQLSSSRHRRQWLLECPRGSIRYIGAWKVENSARFHHASFLSLPPPNCRGRFPEVATWPQDCKRWKHCPSPHGPLAITLYGWIQNYSQQACQISIAWNLLAESCSMADQETSAILAPL